MVTLEAESIIVDPENRNYVHYLQPCRMCEWRLNHVGDEVHNQLFGHVHGALYSSL